MAHKNSEIRCTGHVPGTQVTMIGRSTQTDKYRNLLVDCICSCGKSFTTRRRDIKPSHTVSCGCVKKQRFDDYHRDFADKLPVRRVMTIWNAYNHSADKPTKLTLAKRHSLTKYAITYVLMRGAELAAQHAADSAAERAKVAAFFAESRANRLPFFSRAERELWQGEYFDVHCAIEQALLERHEARLEMDYYVSGCPDPHPYAVIREQQIAKEEAHQRLLEGTLV